MSCFPDATGYALGTVEGRVAIQSVFRSRASDPCSLYTARRHIDEKAAASNFTFKCHRKDSPTSKQSTVFAVNDISFHPYGTFSTSGADGTINFWDKESKTRLKSEDDEVDLEAHR